MGNVFSDAHQLLSTRGRSTDVAASARRSGIREDAREVVEKYVDDEKDDGAPVQQQQPHRPLLSDDVEGYDKVHESI